MPSSKMETAGDRERSRQKSDSALSGEIEVAQSEKHAMEKRIKRHWYPLVLFTIALNLCLVCSAFYIIYNADKYEENETLYKVEACMIIFVPLLVIMAFLFSPWPRYLRHGRVAFSERTSSPRWQYIIHITAALASFLITLSYLLLSAVPKYNTPIWQSSVRFVNEVPVPAVALIIQHTDYTGRELMVNYTQTESGRLADAAIFTANRSFLIDGPGILYQESFNFDGVGTFTALVANASGLRQSVEVPLGSGIQVSLAVTYNSSRISTVPRSLSQILLAVFDDRMSITKIVECGLVQMLSISAFADSMFLLSTSQITDLQRLIRPSANYPSSCQAVYSDLMADPSAPFSLFDTSLTQSFPSAQNFATDCDVAKNASVSCRCSVGFVYGTQFVNSQASMPGRSKQNIWIDCGAIVGAVQFFAWVAMTFFLE